MLRLRYMHTLAVQIGHCVHQSYNILFNECLFLICLTNYVFNGLNFSLI